MRSIVRRTTLEQDALCNAAPDAAVDLWSSRKPGAVVVGLVPSPAPPTSSSLKVQPCAGSRLNFRSFWKFPCASVPPAVTMYGFKNDSIYNPVSHWNPDGFVCMFRWPAEQGSRAREPFLFEIWNLKNKIPNARRSWIVVRTPVKVLNCCVGNSLHGSHFWRPERGDDDCHQGFGPSKHDQVSNSRMLHKVRFEKPTNNHHLHIKWTWIKVLISDQSQQEERLQTVSQGVAARALFLRRRTSIPQLLHLWVMKLSSHRFAINLRCSPSDDDDIALHFNPRFDGIDKVVFNAFKDGSWGSEECESMPLTRGEPFQLVIKATSVAYKVRDHRSWCHATRTLNVLFH